MKNYTVKNVILYGIGGRIKRLYFRIYELFFSKIEIDRSLLNQFNLKETTDLLKSSYNNLELQPSDNKKYFDTQLSWVGADKFLKDNPLYLYPPNLAVIDFLIKNIKKESNLLDYGCGLSNLIIYLRKIGFNNSFGYDDFSQIKKETIEKFLDKFNISNILLSKEEVLSFKSNIITCICYYWQMIDKDIINKELNNPNLEYILLDYYYAPRHIKGFKIVGVYKNLLIIFKRK